MKLIGRFYSYSYIYEEVKLPFHINERVPEILGSISEFLEEPLLISFNGEVVAKGEIDSYNGKKDKLTITIIVTDPDKEAVPLISLMANIDPIFIEIKIDPNAVGGLKRVNHAFLIKVRATMSAMSKEVGNTNDEMFKLLVYTGKFKNLSLYSQAYQVDVESFYRHMVDFALSKNIPINAGFQEKNFQAYMKHCREEGRCIACGKPSIVEEGLYPVCKKHRDEFFSLGRTEFEKKHKLETK